MNTPVGSYMGLFDREVHDIDGPGEKLTEYDMYFFSLFVCCYFTAKQYMCMTTSILLFFSSVLFNPLSVLCLLRRIWRTPGLGRGIREIN
jgi:hypothetical protein